MKPLTDPISFHTPQRPSENPNAALQPKSLAEFVGQAAARGLEQQRKANIGPSWAR